MPATIAEYLSFVVSLSALTVVCILLYRLGKKSRGICVALTDAKPTDPEGNFVVRSLELKGW